MLALRQPQTLPDKCSVNVLPCRIHHDGPTKVTKRYWAPVVENGEPRQAFAVQHCTRKYQIWHIKEDVSVVG